MSAENVTNPPSLRESSPFVEMYQTTGSNAKVSEFTGVATVTNDYASDLQGVTKLNFIQGDMDYSVSNEYRITFTPYSIVRTNSIALLFSYPVTVEPDPTAISSGCYVQAGSTKSATSDCVKIEGSRLFKISNAIPVGWDREVTLVIKMINPENNWGNIGVKLKTYEVAEEESFLVDMLEGNELIPQLLCYTPCKYCEDDTRTVLDKDYCTECWQD